MWSSRQPYNLRTWSSKGSEFPSPTLGELRRSHTWVLRGTTESAKFIALVAPDTKIYQAPEEGNPWTGAGHQVGGRKFFSGNTNNFAQVGPPAAMMLRRFWKLSLRRRFDHL